MTNRFIDKLFACLIDNNPEPQEEFQENIFADWDDQFLRHCKAINCQLIPWGECTVCQRLFVKEDQSHQIFCSLGCGEVKRKERARILELSRRRYGTQSPGPG